jgi:hypothetical protein
MIVFFDAPTQVARDDHDTASTASSTAAGSVEDAKAAIVQSRPAHPTIQFSLTLSSAPGASVDDSTSWKELTVYNPTRRAIAIRWYGSTVSFTPTSSVPIEPPSIDPTRYTCTLGCYALKVPRFPPLRHYYRYRGVDFDVIRPGCTRRVRLHMSGDPPPVLQGCKKILVAWRKFDVKLKLETGVDDGKEESPSGDRPCKKS